MDKSLTFETDQSLLIALRKSDPAAFEFLYRQYYRMVAKQANDYRLPDAEVEDLFQEVLLVLVQKVRTPEFELTAKLSTYLFAVARNLLLKKTGKYPNVSLDEDITLGIDPQMQEDKDAEDLLEGRLLAVTDCMKNLDADCQTLLLLSFYEKRSQAEIAEAMGYTESFVKVKKHRCLNYLRKEVKQHPFFKDD